MVKVCREQLPYVVPADGWYRVVGRRVRLSEGTIVWPTLLPVLDALRGAPLPELGAR